MSLVAMLLSISSRRNATAMVLYTRAAQFARIWAPCRGEGISYTAVHFPTFVDQFIKCLYRTHRFGFAQEEVATISKGIGKLVEHILLQFRREIDQDVAAEYQVDARKGRAAAQILLAEYDHLAQRFCNAVAMLSMFKKATTILCR